MPKSAAPRVDSNAIPKPRSSAVSVHRVDWCAQRFGSASGYGNAAEQIALALERAGTIVRIAGDPEITGIENAEMIASRRDRTFGDALVIHGAPTTWFRDPSRRTYGFSGCSTDRLPLEWNARLAAVDEIWAPSPWCADAFARAGARSVYAIPLGVDPQTFAFTKRTRGAKLRFLHFSTRPSVREGSDLAVLAFQRAFSKRDDVELVLRTTYAGDIDRFGDPRVTIEHGVLPTPQLAIYYRGFDALVAPSRSDAFGLVPLEAMSTGMPAIYTDAGGMAQYRELGMPVSARAVPATVALGRSDPANEAPWGRWFVPDHDEMVGKMRSVDVDYDRTMAVAETDAAAIAENWTWDRTAAAIVARLNA